jgi:putative protein-disulfide isomerase
MLEFGADATITYVMGGLAREFEDPEAMIVPWLDASDRSGMPFDPRLWREAPIASSYPACMAVKAASEQGHAAAGRYLRALREGLMCFRRKLDGREALVAEARAAGLDVAQFRSSLESHAIVEAFGADLEETRSVSDLTLPSLRLEGPLGVQWAFGFDDGYEGWRAAAVAAGGVAAPLALDPLDAVARFGRAASVEVASACALSLTRAEAALWALAEQTRLRPIRVLTGVLWEIA